MKEQSKKTLLLFGVVFVFALALAGIGLWSGQKISEKLGGTHHKKSSHKIKKNKKGQVLEGGLIGVIEIEGVILDSKMVIEKLMLAEENSDIRAIILRINSPGGAVAPTQEIYDEVLRVDQVKPIYASFGSIAASGGYYIGAAARKIYANRGTLTGSIGVIMQFFDLSELYRFAKVKQENITAGRYKDIGQPNRSMTEEERRLLKEMAANTHQQFMQDILFRRKDLLKEKIEDLAQGQVYSGEMAKKVGLVDELGSLWSLARVIHKELKMSGEGPEMETIEIEKEQNFWKIIENLEGTLAPFKQEAQLRLSGRVPFFL
jgi:protease IV